MKAILIKNLVKKYGELTAVDDLNLAIEEGELFALLGVNGAGKTTTIKMLSCLIKPTQGEALILGDNVKENPFPIKQKINISPQETAIAENLSVFENLELIAGIYGQDGKNVRQSAKEMSERFGLEGVLRKKAKLLSVGMQRRLSIAMALISSPKVLFLDEPTLGLDVLARRELWESIKALKGKITIILTTHYMEEAEALADRIGIMAKGKLIATGTSMEIKNQTAMSTLEDAFVALAGAVV
jgi:ABC-2 type transport system ATP-binding protein